jgi:acetyltransferase-like isoleucine patch superfamily enzyme
MGLGPMKGREKARYVWEVLRYTFSLSNLKTLLLSYGYYIHDQVLGMARIHTGDDPRIHPTASIRNPQNVYLGDNSHINRNCCVWCGESSRITLGDNLLMGPGVMMFAVNHGIAPHTPMTFQPRREEDILVGDDVWLGAGVVVLAGVRIADGCLVAAGAVVTRDLDEPYAIYGGVPAKRIGSRRDLQEREPSGEERHSSP